MLHVVGFTLLVCGFLVVYTSKYIVKKFDLIKYFKANESLELNDKEMEEYRLANAVVFLKVSGFILATPGIVIILKLYYWGTGLKYQKNTW